MVKLYKINKKGSFAFAHCFISLMSNQINAQSILFGSINDMIEMNIFTFDADQYAKYYDEFMKYGRVTKDANLGNELRLKVAKILGIFEIRKCTMKKWNYSSEKMDDSEVDDVILKAAVVLKSYLFDKVDNNLKNALDTLENMYLSKKKGSANYEFFISVLKICFTKHSGHVIKDVEELIIQWQTKTSPSYISQFFYHYYFFKKKNKCYKVFIINFNIERFQIDKYFDDFYSF